MNWKFTDSTNSVVFRTLANGCVESCLVSALPPGTQVLPADPIPEPPANTPAAIPVVVIQSVTMRQARLYLLQLGILDNIPIAIASISDANARAAAQIEWEYAGELHRDNPFVQQLAPAIGFDEADMDEFFQEASKL